MTVERLETGQSDQDTEVSDQTDEEEEEDVEAPYQTVGVTISSVYPVVLIHRCTSGKHVVKKTFLVAHSDGRNITSKDSLITF